MLRSWSTRSTLALALVAAVLLVVPLPLAQADSCRFVLGFATLQGMIPQPVGQCLENEQHNPTNGDGLQHTTKGLLVWRKADNVTAFTDGYITIVNGPRGLEYRRNTVRFSWEANPENLPVVPDAILGAARFAQQPGPSLRFTEFTLGEVHQSLRIGLSGSGFLPGELVTLRGTLIPNQITNTLSGPIQHPILTPLPFCPVEATADNRGSFTATVQNTENPVQGGRVDIQATGQQSGRTISKSGFAGP